ncbi:MAG: disulfide bond formation protein B [Hyphomicrobiales bacterium]|nr:disulfide bond formation protein B [Hyphomicrobiales bacterium]
MIDVEAMEARPLATAATLVALVGSLAILGAWFFEYGLGLKPCPLCLEQRYPYYFGIPLAVMVILGDRFGASRKVLLAALAVIAAGMLWNAILGVFHSGVEWKWWPGPQACSGALEGLGSAGGLAKRLESMSVVRCDEAPWRFLGLSLAGYNVLISLALAAVAAWGVAGEARRR